MTYKKLKKVVHKHETTENAGIHTEQLRQDHINLGGYGLLVNEI